MYLRCTIHILSIAARPPRGCTVLMQSHRLFSRLSGPISRFIAGLATVGVALSVSFAIQSRVVMPVEAYGAGSISIGHLTGVTAIAAGWSNSVALKSDGTVWAWGYNAYGQLGDNTTTDRHVPVEVVGAGGSGHLTGIIAIAAGPDDSVALRSDGTVWAWGSNSVGELGDNTTTDRHVPVEVVGAGGSGHLTGIIAIAAGGGHSVALKSDGTVWAWGYNGYGQLGDNTTTERHVPVEVVGAGGSGHLTGITAIAAGDEHSVALKSNGTVWAWGSNGYGQLGDNTTTDRHVPVEVVGAGGSGHLTGITAIAGGWLNSMALKSNGTVWAWGYNGAGQLGDNTRTDRHVPVEVVGAGGSGHLTGIIAIAAGFEHSVALKSNGTVWAWGYNGYGQLGDNTTTERQVPVEVVRLVQAASTP
jgi:alpha-tubulin suppressor-like RCC1 family protein